MGPLLRAKIVRNLLLTVLVIWALPSNPSGAADPARLPGTFDAVQVRPGSTFGVPGDIVEGWEFYSTSNLTVTHLGIYDKGANGLLMPHQVAIWNLNDQSAPVAQQTLVAGKNVPLTGWFRFAPIRPVELVAGKRYAIVAHYPKDRTNEIPDTAVSLKNPHGGLSIKFAPHLEIGGRRYAYPHKKMAFPSKLTEGAKNATIGPSFRYQVSRDR